jgi:murein tripeptide amidase MpaA
VAPTAAAAPALPPRRAFLAATPDFQTQFGYAKSAPGKANMTLCSKAVGQQFGCLAVTLEMPFKDCA